MNLVQAPAILRSMGILLLMYKDQGQWMSMMQFMFEMYFLCREPSLKVDVDSNTHSSVMLGKAF